MDDPFFLGTHGMLRTDQALGHADHRPGKFPMRAHTHTQIRTHVHTYHTHACMYTHAHACTHTHIHTPHTLYAVSGKQSKEK